MSEERPIKEIQISVDRNAEITALNEELARTKIELENERELKSQLEADLAIISEKEARALAKKLGVTDFDPNNPSDLERLARAKLATGNTATLNNAQVYGTANDYGNDEGYDSEEDLIIDLNRKAKSDDKVEQAQAQAVLRELGKKALKKPLNIELESNMRTIARKPRMLQTESKADFDKRLADWQKKQKWSQVKGSE